MKKLVTTLTASALLMGSLATAVSAAETTGTVTTTTPTAVTGNVTNSAKFMGNNNGFSFTNPGTWNSSVGSKEYMGEALANMGEKSANYMVNFTYQPTDANAAPVTFAMIRGYDSAVWNAMPNKEIMGMPLNTTGNTIYVLSKMQENPFNETDLTNRNAYNNLIAGTSVESLQNFMLNPTPSTGMNTGGTVNIPATSIDDPSKISVNPTPTIDLTTMTPFYKSPGGTMIGYLGPQKLDTTGKGQTDPASGQWVEIYTWMGLAWIVVE
ncbi:hypothetical protein [Saccharibacillus sp. JS10]|uniref:hypothetical protein n=1 Tax=Saccharibacillus sp. JS10 TaxID=2950552 RepID=UPI00210933C0|nr:hypothetical protein [Saccharibacillus sp. JS10]MCQ4088714.1 hypothetical protein [Saccharibacillus sp. JS10]